MKKYIVVIVLWVVGGLNLAWGQRGLLTKGVVGRAKTVPPVSEAAVRSRIPSPAQLLQLSYTFQQQNNGALPRRMLYHHKHPLSTQEMNAAQLAEVHLARQVYYQLKNNPSPQDEDWKKLEALYARPDLPPMPPPEVFLEELTKWVEKHNGRRPRLNIYENGSQIPAEKLKKMPALYEEFTLARRLNYLLDRGVEDKTVRDALAKIQELPTIARWESPAENQFYDGFKNVLPSQFSFADQLQTWVAAHQQCRPRCIIYDDKGKYKRVDQLDPVEKEEYTLASRMNLLLKKGHLNSTVRAQLFHINSLPVWHPEKY